MSRVGAVVLATTALLSMACGSTAATEPTGDDLADLLVTPLRGEPTEPVPAVRCDQPLLEHYLEGLSGVALPEGCEYR